MSRIEIMDRERDILIGFGLDHIVGYFYQEYDAYGNMILDLDTMFTGLTKEGLDEKIQPILSQIPKKHENTIKRILGREIN